MSAVVVRKLSPETHAVLKRRAHAKGISMAAEIRSILDQSCAPPASFTSLADALFDPSGADADFELPPRGDWAERPVDLG